MAHNLLLFSHILGASIFGGFIMLDRLIFRRFFENANINSDLFYKKSFIVLLFSAIVLIFSGAGLIYLNPSLLDKDVFILKLFLAFILLVLFFNCPFFLKKMGKPARSLYRFFVLLLVIGVFWAALFI